MSLDRRARATHLTATEMHDLDQACGLIHRAFGNAPYLVGSAAASDAGVYRDVDVRLMLDDDEFAVVCPTRERWELLSLAIGAYLAGRTGLPIDFQIQRTAEANEKFGSGYRNPLGMERVFAGGGDATPSEWKP